MVELPEKCPICGEKMEAGYLTSVSTRPTRVDWTSLDDKKWVKLNLGWRADFRGARCKSCMIVLLGYSEGMKHPNVSKEDWLDTSKGTRL